MKVTHLTNPMDRALQITIRPEGTETKADVLAIAAKFGGSAHVYEDRYLGRTTVNEIVVRGFSSSPNRW